MKRVKFLLLMLLSVSIGQKGWTQLSSSRVNALIYGDPAPCEGLTNVRDFAVSSEFNMIFLEGGATMGFISGEGIVYVGWNSYINGINSPSQPNQDANECLLGLNRRIPGVKYVNRTHFETTAFPAKNVLYDAPDQTFKAIQRTENLFFILSDQGKIYNWGKSLFFTNRMHPITGKDTTVNQGDDCFLFQKLREIKHPNGLAWKAMKIYNHVGYAADSNGDWWCWGRGTKELFPSTAISLPSVGSNISDAIIDQFTPVRMDRLTVQPMVPQSDDQSTLVSWGGSPGTGMAMSFIGADSLVYTYRYTVSNGSTQAFASALFTPISLPSGVKAAKILRPQGSVSSTFATENRVNYPMDCVLGTDGKIYVFHEGRGPVRAMTQGEYFFTDFVIRKTYAPTTNTIDSFYPDIAGLDKSRNKVIYGERDRLTTGTQMNYAVVDADYGIDYTISKIWSHDFYVLIKSANTNHSYALFGTGLAIGTPNKINTGGVPAYDGDTYAKAVGGYWGDQIGGTQPINSSSLTGLPIGSPYKLINCFDFGSSSSVATPAAGTIDCSKTQIVAAPVAGTPNQHALVVTVNVTTAGSFSPLSVSGSGMSLANGVTSVTATTTGVQQFQIPIKYDGTALANNFQFTIGSAGSCTADLTLKSNPVLKNVYTLQNCTAIAPGTITK